MILALPIILEKHPNLLWCIIGQGDEEQNLKELIKVNNLDRNVKFIGAIYDDKELAPWFLSAKVLVHPAAIGLSLIHAFGYGLPVITHEQSNFHGPEFSALKNNYNGKTFKMDDIFSMSEIIIGTLNDSELIRVMKINALKTARQDYNVDVMVNRFMTICEKSLNSKS